MREASLNPAPCSDSMSAGNTGIMIPMPITSISMVIKINVSDAERFIKRREGIDYLQGGVQYDKRHTQTRLFVSFSVAYFNPNDALANLFRIHTAPLWRRRNS